LALPLLPAITVKYRRNHMSTKNRIIEYREALQKRYNQKKKSGTLSSFLIQPTKTDIKKWVETYLGKDMNNEYDIEILNQFLHTSGKDVKYLKKELTSSDDKYRTVAEQFSQKITTKTIRILDFIALVIDFKQRPYKIFEEKDFIEVSTPSSNDTGNSCLPLKQKIEEEYKIQPEFNSISINGDRDQVLGKLPMDNYFIQMSYLEGYDIMNRDIIYQLERESSLIKSKYRFTDLSQGYFSHGLLQNNKIIIAGNPGVGKSTFAKWVCYQSVKNPEETKKFYLYIQLRSLDFSVNDPLLHYIEQNYWKSRTHRFSHISQFLDSIGLYSLVLDGFDELDSHKALRLTEIVKNYNFIILSRPYGLLNLGKIQYEQLYQIDGFNSASIKNYVNSMMALNKDDKKSPSHLMKIIERNKVLDEYAHNPLMLSYIVLLYLTRLNPEKDLALIESRFALIKEVYRWILDHGNRKGYPNIDFSTQMKNKMYVFSLNMLLDKKFVFESDLDDQENFQIAQNLSSLGLGTQKRHKYKWQFSFDTVTFQEFFAVLYYQDKNISTESILYLLNYPFFWNFGLLYIGMLSSDKSKNSRLKYLMGEVRSKRDVKSKNYFTYLYFMLAAECNTEALNKIILKKDYKEIVAVYKVTYYDAFWNMTSYESLRKLYYKSNTLYRDVILDTFLKEIDATEITSHTTTINFWTDLVFIIKEDGYKSISRSLLNKLRECIEVYTSLKDDPAVDENEELFDVYVNSLNRIHFITDILREIPISILKIYNEVIIELLNNFDHCSKYIYKGLLSPLTYSDLDKLLINDHFQDFIKKYCRKLSLTKKEQVQLVQELAFIQEKVYNILTYDTSIPNKDYLRSNLIYFAEWILENSYSFDEKILEEECFDYMLELQVQNLILLKDPKIYDLIFELAYMADVLAPVIPDDASMKKYLAEQFDIALEGKINLDFLERFVYIIRKSYIVQKSFSEYEPKVFRLFKQINSYYYQSLTVNKLTINKSFDSGDLERVEDLMINLHSVYMGFHGKKLFISKIHEFQEEESEFLIKEIIISNSYGDIVFYEKKYWDNLWAIFNRISVTAMETLSIISNGYMYEYPSNRMHLFKIFTHNFEISKKQIPKLVKEYSFEFFGAFAFIQFHLDNAPGFINKDKIVAKISNLLLDKEVLEYFEMNIRDDVRVAESFLAYIFLHYYLPESQNPLSYYDLENKFIDEDDVADTVIDTILKFCSENDKRLDYGKIVKFKKILGDSFYAKTIETAKRRIDNLKRYDRYQFEEMK